jgi:prophage maintenance system killer protein
VLWRNIETLFISWRNEGAEDVWLHERDALIIHERLLLLHGGLKGVQDMASLQAALARPRQHYSYADRIDAIELAALYVVIFIYEVEPQLLAA